MNIPSTLDLLGAAPRLNIIDLPANNDPRPAELRSRSMTPARTAGASLALAGSPQAPTTQPSVSLPPSDPFHNPLLALLDLDPNAFVQPPQATAKAPTAAPSSAIPPAAPSVATSVTASSSTPSSTPTGPLCGGASIEVHANGGGLRASTLKVDDSVHLPAGTVMCGSGNISGLQQL